jgi:hypothetical protein
MGSLASFTATMLLALLMAIAGLGEIVLASGSTLFGIVLLLAAVALSGYAKKARAAHLYRQKMNGLSQWAQGLGPRSGKGRS